MFPLKDTLPTARPPIATLLLVVATVLAIWLWDAPTVPFLLAAWALWIAGRSVEDSLGRVTFLVFCATLGAAAVGLDRAAGSPAAASWPDLALLGIAGGLVGGFLRLYPSGRVQTLILIPLFASVVEAPPALLATVWLALQSGLLLIGGSDLPAWLPAAAIAVGATVLPVLRPRRNAVYDRATSRPTDSVPRS